ncbi:tetratricopeptide repeat protein [Thermodesulfobacteriota bacterium]
MSDKEHIESLIKEAELYRKQSLLNQAKEKYDEILEFIHGHDYYKKNEKLISAIKDRIRAIDEDMSEVEESDDKPELTDEVQGLITKLFSFSKNKDTAAIEAAIALAKFGQYDKAVSEFERLIKKGPLPLMAATNLLRCHLSLATPDAAAKQFKQWVDQEELSKGDLRYLRGFLLDTFEKKDLKIDLPDVGGPQPDTEVADESGDDILSISSINIEVPEGPEKDKTFEFDVVSQSGNDVSVIVPGSKKGITAVFKPGFHLNKMQCCSPLAVFNSSGIIYGMTKIESGPKRGDYSVDIKISEE